MSFEADLDRARLSVALDLRHPLAYLALHPTLAFAESLGLAVNWLPLTTPTLNPPSRPGPEDDRGVRHRRYRAQAIAREIETYAASQGLLLREFYRSGSAELANRGWLWLRERHPERLVPFLKEAFRAYWALELDPSSEAQVSRVVEAVGGDAAGFRDWSDRDGAAASESLAETLRDAGLYQVPAFVVEDEVFYGRQHLPMIRWILEGRTGPIPI